MNIRDAMVEFDNLDPERLVFSLSEAFRARSYEIIDRKKIDFYYAPTAVAEKCCEAEREIFQKEFAAYSANDFSMYKSIDRESPFTNRGVTNQCKKLDIIKQPDVNSWFLEVEIPQGNYSTNVTVPDVNSFFLFHNSGPITAYSIRNKTQSISTSFASRLYIWAWKNQEDTKTTVYLEAKPINGQIVACSGCSIGYSWWQQANGFAEFKLVKHYALLLEELKRAKDVLIQINRNDNI